jgi:hypothetical protein
MNDVISLNSDKKFSCIKCNYNSDSKRDYLKHQSTNKHKKLCNQIDDNTIKSEQKEFVCACGKKYKYRQGLHSHKQKCDFVETNIICDVCENENENENESNNDKNTDNKFSENNGEDRNNMIYKALTDNIKDVDDLKNFVVNLIVENAKLKQMNEDLLTRITEMIYNNVLDNHNKTINGE